MRRGGLHSRSSPLGAALQRVADDRTAEDPAVRMAEHGQLHTDDMAEHLGISVQAVRGIIRQLGETRLAQGSKKGVYRLA